MQMGKAQFIKKDEWERAGGKGGGGITKNND